VYLFEFTQINKEEVVGRKSSSYLLSPFPSSSFFYLVGGRCVYKCTGI